MNITGGFRVVMARYNVSSNDLAKKLGVSNRGINKAIGSDSIKKMDVIELYCNAIGCSVSELMEEAERASIKPASRHDKVSALINNLEDDILPAIYHLKDEFGKVVYVGQSKRLKARLKDHISKESFFSFDYRTTENNLDDEEMKDIMKFNPELNSFLKSTESTPSVKTLKSNISKAIDCIDFKPEISRSGSTSEYSLKFHSGLITKEKHDFIVSHVLDSAIKALEIFDKKVSEGANNEQK